MSNEKKKLSNLSGDAIDGEKIKGGNGPIGPIVPDFNAALPGEPDPNVQPEPGVDYMPSQLPGEHGDHHPEMDEGLIIPKDPNAPKI